MCLLIRGQYSFDSQNLSLEDLSDSLGLRDTAAIAPIPTLNVVVEECGALVFSTSPNSSTLSKRLDRPGNSQCPVYHQITFLGGGISVQFLFSQKVTLHIVCRLSPASCSGVYDYVSWIIKTAPHAGNCLGRIIHLNGFFSNVGQQAIC